MNANTGSEGPMVATGIPGLDEVLRGGIARGTTCLIMGASGTGKTTAGLQFALRGLGNGEAVTYVALSVTRRDLERIAASHGWQLGALSIVEGVTPAAGYTMFRPDEVEIDAVMKRLREEVERACPARIVIDSLAEIRLMAQSPLRLRREMIAFRRFMSERGCTTLMLDDPGAEGDPGAIVDAVMRLEQSAPLYGSERRQLIVLKVKARDFAGGFHDVAIRKEGLEVYPRLVAAEHGPLVRRETLSSGVPALDDMLGGGLAGGTSTLLLGPAGTGKSLIAMQFAVSAAGRGERAAVFTFDELREDVIERSSLVGMDVAEQVAAGRLRVEQVDPANLSPGQFAHALRREVETHETAVLVLDSLNGYLNAMPGASYLVTQMHELLAYLGRRGVNSFLVTGQAGVVEAYITPANISYLVDNILLLKFFEAEGEVRKAVSVIKKRGGRHDLSIRELILAPEGVRLGERLTGFRGILAGVPVCCDAKGQPLGDQNAGQG